MTPRRARHHHAQSSCNTWVPIVWPAARSAAPAPVSSSCTRRRRVRASSAFASIRTVALFVFFALALAALRRVPSPPQYITERWIMGTNGSSGSAISRATRSMQKSKSPHSTHPKPALQERIRNVSPTPPPVSPRSAKAIENTTRNKRPNQNLSSERAQSLKQQQQSPLAQPQRSPHRTLRQRESKPRPKLASLVGTPAASKGTHTRGTSTHPTQKHSSVEVRASSGKVMRIPKGARTTGALPEFRGVVIRNGALVRGQNITRVSYALYKIVRLFGFRSVVDFPAGSHTEWMPRTVRRIEFDRPAFRYTGVDSPTGVAAARTALQDAGSPDFRAGDVTSPETLTPEADVLFHWTELDASERDPRSDKYPEYIKRVVRAGRKANITYIIFGQYPRLRGPSPAYRHGKWMFLGDTNEKPFLYNDFVRGVVPVMASTQPYVLYMTFYSLRAISD